jgi:hypothetical protein
MTTANNLKRTSAGDFDYDWYGRGDAQQRRPEPRIAAFVQQTLFEGSLRLIVGHPEGRATTPR